jgi:hypothetical protein
MHMTSSRRPAARQHARCAAVALLLAGDVGYVP